MIRQAGAGIPRRSLVVGALLALAIAGTGAWAVTTKADLDQARSTLTSTNADRDSTKATLASTDTELAATSADLNAAALKLAGAKARIPQLQEQISRKGECIAAQAGNLAELRRILQLQRANFARTTSTSVWGKAHAAEDKALGAAITDLYRAYQNAAARKYSSANSWLSASNAQIRLSNSKISISNAEVRRTNARSDAINKARDAFEKKLADTVTACGA
jgi:septal ring factor EnvC (AmiA/AmiB activator)